MIMEKDMTEILPITISVDAELAKQLTKLTSVTNKLEAQFNFQALTANWFGDEDNILVIKLYLETPITFIFNTNVQKNTIKGSIYESRFSDDVVCYFNQDEKLLRSYIAFTDSELALLTEQPKLLVGFIETKCRKVLNLIAQQQSLNSI
jgi:hypothetical protein